MSNETPAVEGGRTDYNDPAGWIKPPPLELWVVVDKMGNTSTARNEDHARAKAVCYDNDYPNSAPHYAVRMVEAPSC